MQVHFLSAPVPLTKTYERNRDGTLTKSPYPNVFHVSSHTENVPDLLTFEALIKSHGALGHCLIKGQLSRTLATESRAGSTNTADVTEWLCLDFDGVPTTWNGQTVTPDIIMQMIGLGDVSYILQWSGSQGVTATNELRFHVFVMMNKATPAPIIKQWLIQTNHAVPMLRDCMALTKTGNSLTWGLDITACQNDKLIYIAPPILKRIPDPFKTKSPRISLRMRPQSHFTFPTSTNTSIANRALTDARIHELREAAGLPTRKFNFKAVKGTEVLVRPEVCTITDQRNERGFVYFNLNGGDSWAYYHPEDKPDIIYNFKGEPNYLTKELLPDYWERLVSKASRTSSTGLTYLAFLDRKSGVYYRGTHDNVSDILDITPAKNETQIRHFAEQYGVPLGSFIPEWDLTFDPHDSVRVDHVNRTINTFQLTEFQKTTVKKVLVPPPTVLRIIHHALGEDSLVTEHFMNWLAFILQERTRTLTAWVMHGTEGTGKGILMNRILRPIFGKSQTASRRMEELNEPYNVYMKQCFLVFIDEVEAKALINEKGVMAKLRNFITEGSVTIRQMYASAVECPNFTNWIFSSNKPEPVLIPRGDRRFNVGKYQGKKLGMTDTELALIPGELQAFHDYLMCYAVDKVAAATPLDSADRDTMIDISENSIDTVARKINDGNMEFLLDQLPATTAYTGNAANTTRIEDYKHALQSIMLRTDPATGRCNISRDELRVIFDYVVGKIPESPNKFTSLLKHHRIYTVKVRVDDKAVYGLKTEFKDVSRFGEYANTYFPQPVQNKAPLKVKAKT